MKSFVLCNRLYDESETDHNPTPTESEDDMSTLSNNSDATQSSEPYASQSGSELEDESNPWEPLIEEAKLTKKCQQLRRNKAELNRKRV